MSNTITAPKLSICIPTYNFASYLKGTLESIIYQNQKDIEVVIVDGASTDNTQEIVESFQKDYPFIKYYRQKQKGGIDHDMALTIKYATAEFCWLFSGDDIMEESSLAFVMNEIKENNDVLIASFDIYTKDMRSFILTHPIFDFNKPKVFQLQNETERRAFFQSAITTTAFFSFMSSLVIKKSKWLECEENEIFAKSCWAHAAKLLSVIPRGLLVKYTPERLLKKRAGNDSFMDKGIVNRFAIGIEGYQKIGNEIFGEDSLEAYHIRRVLRNEYTLCEFISNKRNCQNALEIEKMKSLLKKTFYEKNRSWIFRKNLFVFCLISPLSASLLVFCGKIYYAYIKRWFHIFRQAFCFLYFRYLKRVYHKFRSVIFLLYFRYLKRGYHKFRSVIFLLYFRYLKRGYHKFRSVISLLYFRYLKRGFHILVRKGKL